jgi:hypothetical protein
VPGAIQLQSNFSLAELAVGPPPRSLRVLTPLSVPLPAGARPVDSRPRPRWLGTLLPVFRSTQPLRVALVTAAAPAFGRLLLRSLAQLLATAGRDTGIRVAAWEDGLAAGVGSPSRLPAEPHAVLVVAELEETSVGIACDALESVPERARWLVLHGRVGVLDSRLGLEPAAQALGARLARLPTVADGRLARMARDLAPAFADPAHGRACLRLASGLVADYRRQAWP